MRTFGSHRVSSRLIRVQVIVVRWLRRRSVLSQSLVTCLRKAPTRLDVVWDCVVGHVASHHTVQPTTQMRDRLVHTAFQFSLILTSAIRIRLAIVTRLSLNRPSLLVPQICVNPRKSNVSGLPRPRSQCVLVNPQLTCDAWG